MTEVAGDRLCARCTAGLPGSARFCIRCGEPAETGDVPGLAAAAEARLVHCPSCDGANAASRQVCARCGAVLREDSPDAPFAVPVPVPATAAAPAGDMGLPATLLVVTVLAALAIVGVLLTILSARGVGLFAGSGAPATPGEPVPVEPVEAGASSEVPASGAVTYGAANLLDGDETTAWKEGVAGHGEGEWVELRFAEPIPVARLLVWNGYQSPGRYAEHNRVASARIEVGERPFTADLLDVEGPQAIDLPEAVIADRVRVVILDVHRGERYEDTAMSRLEVHVRPGSEG